MQIGKHQLTLCRYGWMLHAGPYIGKCFELYGQYSEAEVRVLRTFLRPANTALDIGANIGDLTLPMARIVGETGRVYAIESHTSTYHVLCANLALNGLHHVKAINCFAAHSPDVDTAGPWGKYGFVSEVWGAPIIPVDALGIETCNLIKIDVDGKELEVLRSADRLIERCRPVLYFENDSKPESAAVLEHVLRREYNLYWHPAQIFEPDNFFGNPVNHWAPRNIISLMMLALPREMPQQSSVPLRQVAHKDEWWDDLRTA